jgi:hypothetical protein
MFASIRSYKLNDAPIDDLADLVAADFADRLAGQPGFVAYAFVDCDDGDALTISVFREREQAAASRALAKTWVADRAGHLDLTLVEAVNGSIPVSRAAPELLTPGMSRFARVRRYKVAGGDLGEVVWRVVDTGLAEQMSQLGGFLAYFVFSSRDGDLVAVSIFRDWDAASISDAVALKFVRERLAGLEIERTEAIGGGEIIVSRITAGLLESVHT